MSQFSHLVQEGKVVFLADIITLAGNGSKRPFQWSFSFGSSPIYFDGIDIVLLDMISLNYHIVTNVSPAFSVLWKNCTAVVILLRIL